MWKMVWKVAWKVTRIFLLFFVLLLSGWLIQGNTAGPPVLSGVVESGYSLPFSLQKGGEGIDILVRARNRQRIYQFNLVLVEPLDWPEERKDQLRRVHSGLTAGDTVATAYPFRLRIRIDSADGKRNVHVDEIVSQRSPFYEAPAENGTAVWRAQKIYARGFVPGVYRVRVENLLAVPHIDFKTLFEFERIGNSHTGVTPAPRSGAFPLF